MSEQTENGYILIERIRFILKQKIKTLEEYERVEAMSYLWINYKLKKCVYSKEVMDELKKYYLPAFNLSLT